mgnify:CR=1 FL=1
MLNTLSDASDRAPDGIRLVIMPSANPDGCDAGTRVNANLIDINRNFPTLDFGTGDSSGQYYGGERPASEPETQAIVGVIERYKPELIISLHAPLACVNYNGPSVEIAGRISRATGLPAVGDIGYPCPGSMGTYYGHERRIPLITLELPQESADPERYAEVLLDVLARQAGGVQPG